MSLEVQHIVAWTITLGLPAVALASGLLHQRFPRAPLMAGIAVAGAYALLLLVSGSWASSCWECASDSDPIMRKSYFTMALIWGGMFTALVWGTIWLGVLLSRMISRRLTTE